MFTHDDVVGDHTTFGAGARLAGGVVVEPGAYVGAGALVREYTTIGAGALVLGVAYLYTAVRFWSEVSDSKARRLLRASFVYLPAILILLLLNPMPA